MLEGRSKSAASCSSGLGINFGSAPLCFVHVMHGLTLVYIYTDKTTLKCDKEFDGKGVGAQREKEKRGGEDG